jgi:Putative zinc-finger
MIDLWIRDRHLSDEEMLLVADRECSPRSAAKVREHLAQCAPCHERMIELETTLAEFVAMRERTVLSQPPASDRLRRTLKARLSEAGRNSTKTPLWLPPSAWATQFARACIALLIVGGSLWLMRDIVLQKLDLSGSDQIASALPRPRLTPGATRAVRLDDLCQNDDADQDPPVNISLEQQVLAEYGVPVAARHGYQLDYLIAPELGGTADIHNLWPEPYSSTSWNAHVKDVLEEHLHEMVCQGKLPLATAQEEIATDWIAAYKREFHTDTPLSNAATLNSAVGLAAIRLPRGFSAIQTPIL